MRTALRPGLSLYSHAPDVRKYGTYVKWVGVGSQEASLRTTRHRYIRGVAVGAFAPPPLPVPVDREAKLECLRL